MLLINWDKYVKLGRIGIDFKRYQDVCFRSKR